ncbi:putative transmembrane protein [Toxoplasma gondii MAS]|uniref:Putative transmembrane protein n=1 Tax=Toxoplasma gondii MAS TaxID=943118 RepID=A0A086Q116_TOXGO|nr:putative transmembrane protein [Toxoplasma gondii MAS]
MASLCLHRKTSQCIRERSLRQTTLCCGRRMSGFRCSPAEPPCCGASGHAPEAAAASKMDVSRKQFHAADIPMSSPFLRHSSRWPSAFSVPPLILVLLLTALLSLVAPFFSCSSDTTAAIPSSISSVLLPGLVTAADGLRLYTAPAANSLSSFALPSYRSVNSYQHSSSSTLSSPAFSAAFNRRKYGGCLGAALFDATGPNVLDMFTPSVTSLSPCSHPEVGQSSAEHEAEVSTARSPLLTRSIFQKGVARFEVQEQSRTFSPVQKASVEAHEASHVPILPLLKSLSGNLPLPFSSDDVQKDGMTGGGSDAREDGESPEGKEQGSDGDSPSGTPLTEETLGIPCTHLVHPLYIHDAVGKRVGIRASVDAAVGLAASDFLGRIAKMTEALQNLSETLLRKGLGQDSGGSEREKHGNKSEKEGSVFLSLASLKLPLEGSTASDIIDAARQRFRAVATSSIAKSARSAESSQPPQETEVAAAMAEGEQRLESILDSSLRAVFQQQMSLLLLHILQRVNSSTSASVGFAGEKSTLRPQASPSSFDKQNALSPSAQWMQEFEALLRRAVPNVDQRRRWGANTLRAQLQKHLADWERERDAENSKEIRRTRSQQALLQVLQRQQEQVEQLQQHIQQSQQPTPFSFGAAYRVPDTNLQLAAAARQGKLHVNVSCLPDEAAAAGAAGGILGNQGFVKGVEAAGNLGLSVNFGM